MHTFRRAVICGLLLTASLAGCSDDDDPGAVDTLNVSGRWSGGATLPNPRSTVMTLQQSGSGVSGQMSVSGSFPQGLPVTGTIDVASRTVTWAVARDCEVWGGVLTVSGDRRQMSGPLVINRSGCQPAQSNGSGNLTLNRE